MKTIPISAFLLVAAIETVAAPVPVNVAKPVQDWNGDPLPKFALSRLGSARWRTGEYRVFAVAVSKDGRTTHVAGSTGLAAWDADGRFVGDMFPPNSDIIMVGFGEVELAADGRHIVHASKNWREVKTEFVTYELATRREVRRYAIPHQLVQRKIVDDDNAVQYESSCETRFAPGAALAVTMDTEAVAHVWDVVDGRPVRVLALGAGRVDCFAFGDATTLVTVHRDGAVRVHDLATGRESAWFAVDGVRNRVALSADGRRVACSSPRVIGPALPVALEMWDVKSGRKIWTTDMPFERMDSLAFTADGDVVALGRAKSGVVGRWDGATGRRVWSDDSLPPWPQCLRVEGSTALVVANGRVRRWDAATGREWPTPEGHAARIQRLEFARDGATVTTIATGARHVWDAATGKPLGRETLRSWNKFDCDYAPDAARAVEGDSRSHRLRDVATDRVIAEWTRGGYSGSTFAPDGGRVAIYDDRRVLSVRESASGKEIWAEKVPMSWRRLTTLLFAPDGGRLAYADGRTLRIFDAANGKQLIERDLSELVPLLWHGDPPRQEPNDPDRAAFVESWAFSRDGKSLAVGLVGRLVILDVRTGEPRGDIAVFSRWANALAWSPDGRTLAVSGRDLEGIRLHDVASGRELRKLIGHRGYVTALAFSPDGKRLASAAFDLTALIWDASDLRP